MTTAEQQNFEDLLLRAVQSGKEETSGLVSEIFKKLDSHIEVGFEKNFNGKMKKVLENQNNLENKVDAYIKSDTERWTEYEPYIKGVANISGAGKIIVWLAVGLSAVVAAFLSIKNLLK